MQNTNWEIYAEIRQQALAFLDAHGLIPETLYIAADGWVEAIYTYTAGNTSITDRWQHVRQKASVNVRRPILEVHDQRHKIKLHVYFNLAREKQSLWQRLRWLIS